MKVNNSSCHHIEEGSLSICGAFANVFVQMPKPIPNMPVCEKHYHIYQDEATRLVFMKAFFDWLMEGISESSEKH